MKARIHWNVQKKMWTVHTYKGCEWSRYVSIDGEWYTETKPTNKSNPRGFVVCDRADVYTGTSFPANMPTVLPIRLDYDKQLIQFSRSAGRGISFTPWGAWCWDMCSPSGDAPAWATSATSTKDVDNSGPFF